MQDVDGIVNQNKQINEKYTPLCLQERVHNEFGVLLKENEAASQRRCREVLEKLADTIKKKQNIGAYARDGGLHDYENDINSLKKSYRNMEGLGVKVIYLLQRSFILIWF